MSDLLNPNSLLLPTFPNVATAVRIYLTIPVNNCEGERSFSTLSRVKNYLRSTMAQDRLGALSLMCIECDMLKKLDLSDLVMNFAAGKSRKKDF